MKKTMFITSVIMVIVLAVALTTSSLAWFSASGNATVYTDTLKLTAKATASTGLSISHDGLDWLASIPDQETSLELRSGDNINTNLMPLVPFNKDATTSAVNLLAALVGGSEAPMISLADFAVDYAKYIDESNETVATYAAVYAVATADTTPGIWGEAESGSYGGEAEDIIDEEEYEDFEEGILLEGKDGYDDDFVAFYEQMIANGYISTQDVKGVTETALYNDRAAYMIGNKLDFNSDFTADLYRDGFYYDTFYIKNVATGTGSQNVNLDTIISFYSSNPIPTGENDPDTGKPIVTWETENYQRTYRGDKYDQDPTLCVAVIAKKNAADNGVFMTDRDVLLKAHYQHQIDVLNAEIAELDSEDPEYAETKAGLDEQIAVLQGKIDALTGYTWEIIGYAESKGAVARNYYVKDLNMGLTAEGFAAGEASKDSVATLSTSEFLTQYETGHDGDEAYRLPYNTNSVALRPDRSFDFSNFKAASNYTDDVEYSDQELYEMYFGADRIAEVDTTGYYSNEGGVISADVLEVKVIAWYDGTTLNNNNSNNGLAASDYKRGSANIEFRLQFISK